MKELREKFPSGKDFLALSDHQKAAVLLKIIVDRADNPDPPAAKYLSIGELENIYDSVSLPAASQKQINYSLMEAHQRLLSQGYTMPAPGQPAGAGVFTATSKGRAGLPTEGNVENKSLREWAGGPRVTLAIVFTDIVGSTALGSKLGDVAMGEVRRRHFAQSTGLLAEHAGREIKTLGDSVMAVFRSVEAAFGYALALHLNPGHEALTAGGIRAGIHIGSVDVDEKNVDGNEVSFAHRVTEAIRGAEIWLSDRAKGDIDLAGIDQQWQPHDVPLKGFLGDRRLWSLLRPERQGQQLTSDEDIADNRSAASAAQKTSAAGFIALGPDVVCIGEITGFSAVEWELHLHRFVIGNLGRLMAFSEAFERLPPNERYVLVNALGDGRQLVEAPSLSRGQTGDIVKCRIFPKFSRIRAQDIEPGPALSLDGHDLFATNGNMASVSGLAALPQTIKTCLSFLEGESPVYHDAGSRLAEYFYSYRTAPWLEALLRLEVIRQAAIPYSNSAPNEGSTPLRCVEFVWGIELLSDTPEDRWLPIRLDLEVRGVGRQKYDISILIPPESTLRVSPKTASRGLFSAIYLPHQILRFGRTGPSEIYFSTFAPTFSMRRRRVGGNLLGAGCSTNSRPVN